MADRTALERRSDLLADGLKDFRDKLTQNLTEPKPYRQQHVPEEVQVRKYLQVRDTGGLPVLREQMGDDNVNRYVQSMQGRAQKYLNLLAQKGNTDAKEATPDETRRGPGDQLASYYHADDDLETF